MPIPPALELYREHYTARGFERRELFEAVAGAYPIRRALYPGCFVHVTPSLFFPETTYVEMDRRAPVFFADPAVTGFVNQHKRYPEAAQISFHAADYRARLPLRRRSFDLLISLYAGFISPPCRPYLKLGGWLLANDSHGDASLAAVDPAFRLVGVLLPGRGRYRLVTDELSKYFVPRSGQAPTREQIETLGRGLAYQHRAEAYLFQRVR